MLPLSSELRKSYKSHLSPLGKMMFFVFLCKLCRPIWEEEGVGGGWMGEMEIRSHQVHSICNGQESR